MKTLVDCTKEELEAFVAAYPRKLDRDVFGASEPPLVTFNDFTLGVWPDSVVAKFHAGDDPSATERYYGPASGFKILR